MAAWDKTWSRRIGEIEKDNARYAGLVSIFYIVGATARSSDSSDLY